MDAEQNAALWEEDLNNTSFAAWWPKNSGPCGGSQRELWGEIAIPKNLQPTTAIAHISISVRYLLFISVLNLIFS
jgi:hypothetical protein